MLLKILCRHSFTLLGEFHDSGAPVPWRGSSNDQPTFLEAIDRGGHRPPGEQDLVLNLRDGQRTFVQQGFQRCKIRKAQFRIQDALFGEEPQPAMAPRHDPPQFRTPERILRQV